MGNVKQTEQLLRYELRALTAYQQIMNELQNQHELLTLIYGDHYDAVFTLQKMMQEKIDHSDEIITERPGVNLPWRDNSNLNDKRTFIKLLLEIEKDGAESYVEALKQEDSHPDLFSLIELKFLPIQQAHVRSLDRILLAESL